MNIVYFTNYYSPQIGAASIYTEKIIQYLAKKGHKIIVLVRGSQTNPNHIRLGNKKDRSEEFHQNIRIWRSNPRIKHPYSAIFSHGENFITFIHKFRQSFRPHIIISQYHSFHLAPVFGALLARFFKIPHVVRSHDIFSPYYGKLQEKAPLLERVYLKTTAQLTFKSIKYTDLFFTTSSEHKMHLQSNSLFKKTCFKLHPNGIHIQDFIPVKSNQLKRKFNCKNLITYIGLLDIDLGIQYFIDSMVIINETQPLTHFLIIGMGKDKKYLEKYIIQKGIQKYIHILPPVIHSEIQFYVNNSDFCLGILTEDKLYRYCIPVKCVEYMACKKTFISTLISKDISFFNYKSNKTGITIANINTKEIAKQSLKLLRDIKYREELENNGYNLIQKNYNWDNLMSYFESEIINCLKKKCDNKC
ncbi:glycosyltransferase family 4 protein [Candidatus Lokiarchaeum ossiferum]|uniref:glycosyltransferase family 4 protein n=1 Tax=Candidatus Lokiarchaeum ossiferum TaxID=2951803 RepID=UPI00352E8E82